MYGNTTCTLNHYKSSALAILSSCMLVHQIKYSYKIKNLQNLVVNQAVLNVTQMFILLIGLYTINFVHIVWSLFQSFLDYFARALDFEYRSKGIIVQSLMPFYVATKMTRFSHTLSNPGLLIPSAERYAESAVATLGYTSRTSGYWPHTIQVQW